VTGEGDSKNSGGDDDGAVDGDSGVEYSTGDEDGIC
jgi:hypothetical protein